MGKTEGELSLASVGKKNLIANSHGSKFIRVFEYV